MRLVVGGFSVLEDFSEWLPVFWFWFKSGVLAGEFSQVQFFAPGPGDAVLVEERSEVRLFAGSSQQPNGEGTALGFSKTCWFSLMSTPE